MLRQAETVRPSSTIAITAMMINVPSRAIGRMGLAARAIGVFLLMLLIERFLIEILESFLGDLVYLIFERAQPAYDRRSDSDADLPGHDDQDDRHAKFQQRWTHTTSRRRGVGDGFCSYCHIDLRNHEARVTGYRVQAIGHRL